MNSYMIETNLTAAVIKAERALNAATERNLSESTHAKLSRAYWAARDNMSEFYAGLAGESPKRGACWAYYQGQKARGV